MGATTTHAVLCASVLGACGRVGFEGTDHDGSDAMHTDAAGDGDGVGCVLPMGSVVHLMFDEGMGLQTVDASGAGNDAQLVGMDESDWVAGRITKALDFDGVDDHVNAGSAAILDDLAPLTMCAWIYPRSYPNQFPAIADKSNDTFIGGWNFYLEDNAQVGFLTNERKWITGGTITLGVWTHVCVSWDGTAGFAGIQLLQDASLAPMKSSGSNGNQRDSDSAHDLLVGRVNNGTFPFDGLIDDFIAYPRVLTLAEINAIYSCGMN